jgi:hypothetical protein
VITAARLDRVRAVEDLVLLRELGVAQVRVGIDWAWTQPSPGTWNGDAVELYSGLGRDAAALGIDLQFTLLERDVPKWFDNEGGFGDARWALHWWPRWVEGCAERFGEAVGGWVPMEHPLALANAMFRDDPRRHGDVLDTLVSGWRDAWRILRGGPPVSTAFGLEVVRPVDQTIQAADAARRLDQIRWGLWLEGLRDGVARIPGRADREVADLAGACDVVGVVIRHEEETMGLVHRAAEQAPERPMAVTYLVRAGADADRETAVERYVRAADDIAAEVGLRTVALSPAFDTDDAANGIITRDRDAKDSARVFLQ